MGSGALRAVAKESALKLLELTAGKTLTMSESVLGLRHGPMAALDQEHAVRLFSLGQPARAGSTSGICWMRSGRSGWWDAGWWWAEVKYGQGLAGGTLSGTEATSGIADDYRPAVDIIFGQLLGLFGSLRWNLRPDSPSPNGAISRVVHGVNIHS